MEIIEYEDKYQAEWDNFVKEHPESRFVHLIGFKNLIEKTFHYPAYYWLIREKNKNLALFSGFGLKGFLREKRMISQPFSSCGGLLINPDLSQAELLSVFEFFSVSIKNFLADSHFKFLEIHGCPIFGKEIFEKFSKKIHLYQYAVFKLDLLDNIWQKKLNYEVKKAIRRAQKFELTIFHKTSQKIIQKKFYPLYLISMKRLGSPPQSLEYFLKGLECLKDSIEFFWAEYNKKPIAGLLGWKCGQGIQITDTVSDSKFWPLRANDLLHWEFIKWASQKGFKYFDFGPARYEGQLRYKEKWGCDFSDYYYYYFSPNPKFSLKKPLDDTHFLIKKLSFLWQKIMPMSLTPLLGKNIRRWLGK